MIQARQKGAVSIFIVVFTALLVTVVTTSFIQIMVRNQQQASNSDLSQSAYDSALAGVEDSKRVLIKLRDCQSNGDAACVNAIQSALDSQDCKTLGELDAADFIDGKESIVGEDKFNQAYTCVKIQTKTPNVQGTLTGSDDTKVFELRGVRAFNKIRLSWYNQADVGEGASLAFLDTATYPLQSLPKSSEWPATMPPIMRLQLIQFSRGSISLNAFDGDAARTHFAYPASGVPEVEEDFGNDDRTGVGSSHEPNLTYCSDNPDQHGGYYCTVTLRLPAQVDREAYLQLAAIYNKAHYQVELLDSANEIVDFDGVQPIVDATGRASDLFRRVKARVSIGGEGSSLQFPNAALSIKNNLCKDFFITNDRDDYDSPAGGQACDPASAPVGP